MSGKRKTSKVAAKKRLAKIVTLLIRDGLNCHICGQPFTEDNRPTLSHLLPRVLGGTEANENLALAHGPCNNSISNPPLGRRREKEDGAVVLVRDHEERASA